MTRTLGDHVIESLNLMFAMQRLSLLLDVLNLFGVSNSLTDEVHFLPEMEPRSGSTSCARW